MLEEFRAWKMFGQVDIWSLDAKTAEALLILDEAQREENKNG